MHVLFWLSVWSTLALRPVQACELEVEALSVGQGDSILIRNSQGMAILVDAGTESSPVEDLLAERGITTLDLAINSHPHADHLGAMDRVIRKLDVLTYVDNGMKHDTKSYLEVLTAVEETPTNHQVVSEGDNWRFGDVNIDVLFPRSSLLKNTRSDLNANSVVLRIDHLKDCFLLTGDAEEVTEDALMDAGLETCDVLKVGHHGSRYSTSDRLLSRLEPSIAVISAGRKNRYKHPHKEALERLESNKVEVWRTDLHGSIRMVSTGGEIKVFPESEAGTATPVAKTEQTAARQIAAEAVRRSSNPPTIQTTGSPNPPHSSPTYGTYSSGKSTTPHCAWVGQKNKRVVYKASCPKAQKIAPDQRICYPNATVPKTLGRKLRSCKAP